MCYATVHIILKILLYLGTVMADTFGVAKKATAVAIPVLNQFGSGSTM